MSSALPENSTLKFSYEHALDVDVSDGVADPDWARVRFIDQLNPQSTPVTVPAQTYEDKGAPNDIRTSESWQLTFNVQAHTVGGKYLPEVEALLKRCEPEVVGNAALIPVRWYDYPDGSRDPVLDEAYSGLATVSYTRGATGADGQVEVFSFTLTGKGRRAKIAHPDAPAGP